MGGTLGSGKSSLMEEHGCKVRVIHLEKVALAKKEEISEKELERLTLIYKALADPSRLRIVMALRNHEMCVCDLAAFLGVSESAVSHQLRRLKDLGLVKKRRDGQVLYYSLDDHHVGLLLDVSLEHIGHK
jgi:DNA-binding transcriptional ArsR family regulator